MTESLLPQIIIFVGALLSGALGGYIAIRVSRDQLKHQERQAAERRHIDNMEKLHDAFSELATTARHFHVAILARISKNIPFDKSKFGDISFDRMNMLIDFYVPSLRKEGDHVFRNFNQLFAVGAEVQEGVSVDGEAGCRHRAFEATKRVHEATESAKKKLAELMQPYRVKNP